LQQIPTDGLDPEISLGVDLNLCALERCLHAIAPERHSPGQVALVQQLKARFDTLWKKRSRVGGLVESLGLIDPVKICAARPQYKGQK
jgi:hypothetical protein